MAVITNFSWEVLVSFRHWDMLLFFGQNLQGTENKLDYLCKLRGLLICKSLYIFWVISHLRFCEVLEFYSVENEQIKSAFVSEWKSLSLFSKWLRGWLNWHRLSALTTNILLWSRKGKTPGAGENRASLLAVAIK